MSTGGSGRLAGLCRPVLNIARSLRLGLLPKLVTFAPNLAQDTGSGFFASPRTRNVTPVFLSAQLEPLKAISDVWHTDSPPGARFHVEHCTRYRRRRSSRRAPRGLSSELKTLATVFTPNSPWSGSPAGPRREVSLLIRVAFELGPRPYPLIGMIPISWYCVNHRSDASRRHPPSGKCAPKDTATAGS